MLCWVPIYILLLGLYLFDFICLFGPFQPETAPATIRPHSPRGSTNGQPKATRIDIFDEDLISLWHIFCTVIIWLAGLMIPTVNRNVDGIFIEPSDLPLNQWFTARLNDQRIKPRAVHGGFLRANTSQSQALPHAWRWILASTSGITMIFGSLNHFFSSDCTTVRYSTV